MKKVIYYFSGTGNSMRAAMRIAKEIGGAEIISVRNNPEEVSRLDAEVIGFICPVYEWDIPRGFEAFVKKLSINRNAYIFMVCTYIMVHGKCFETMEALLQNKGAHLSYGYPLRCVASQCTAYTPFPPENIMHPITERNITKISKEIKALRIRPFPHMSPITRKLYPKMMIPYKNVENEYDKGFYISDACIGCKTCEKVCPIQNITTTEDKHPIWHHACNGCMACVAYCPTKAILYKSPEAYLKIGKNLAKNLSLPANRKRYHNPHISAQDMMVLKQYIH